MLHVSFELMGLLELLGQDVCESVNGQCICDRLRRLAPLMQQLVDISVPQPWQSRQALEV